MQQSPLGSNSRIPKLAMVALAIVVSLSGVALVLAAWIRGDAFFLLLGLTTLPLGIGLGVVARTNRDPDLGGTGDHRRDEASAG